MAITHVSNTTFQVGNGSGSVNVSLPASLSEDDIVIYHEGCRDSLNTDGGIKNGSASGWTEVVSTSLWCWTCITYKLMSSTPDSTVNVDRNTSEDFAVLMQAWRGVDTTTPGDVSRLISFEASGMPNPGSRTTVTDGALRLIFGTMENRDYASSVTAPSGYSNLVTEDTGNASTSIGATVMIASKIAATAGAEDPDAFGGSASQRNHAVHWALKPAAGGTNTDIPVDAGSFSLTGNDATISTSTNTNILPDAGSFSYTGYEANIIVDIDIEPNAYVYTGYDAALSVNRSIVPDAESFGLTGYDISIGLDLSIMPDSGSFALTGYEISIGESNVIMLDTGMFAYAGYNLTIDIEKNIFPSIGTFSMTGNDMDIIVSGTTIQPNTGVFSMLGYPLGEDDDPGRPVTDVVGNVVHPVYRR